MTYQEPKRNFRHIDVTPKGASIGAEVAGVDLSQDLPDDAIGEIRQALLDHLVIYVRGQSLTPEQHKAFGGRFGTFNVHPHVKPLPGHPEILDIVKEPGDKLNFGGGWHSDMTFLPEPVMGSILYAVEVPARGGDTLWANMYDGYESLSETYRTMLDGLQAVHTANEIYGADGLYQNPNHPAADKSLGVEEAKASTTHPMVRTHPETGRKGLFVNPAFTTKIAGMSKSESRPILQFLYDHGTKPEFVYRHHWQKGDVVFWDNRCTQHYALNDYHGQRRQVHRVTINGDRPY